MVVPARGFPALRNFIETLAETEEFRGVTVRAVKTDGCGINRKNSLAGAAEAGARSVRCLLACPGGLGRDCLRRCGCASKVSRKRIAFFPRGGICTDGKLCNKELSVLQENLVLVVFFLGEGGSPLVPRVRVPDERWVCLLLAQGGKCFCPSPGEGGSLSQSLWYPNSSYLGLFFLLKKVLLIAVRQ